MLSPGFHKRPGVMNDICAALRPCCLALQAGFTSASHLTHTGKEYSKADSRYAARDHFVVSMEAVTAFVEGPGCWAIVYGILNRRPWVYVLQLAVSLGQLYGDVLYFATAFMEGKLLQLGCVQLCARVCRFCVALLVLLLGASCVCAMVPWPAAKTECACRAAQLQA